MSNFTQIFSVNIFDSHSKELLKYISKKISIYEKVNITYSTVHTINQIIQSSEISKLFNSFDLIHPDGIGVYLGSKILYGNNGLKNRFTGSDFYPYLIEKGNEAKWKFFFFGDTDETLNNIQRVNPGLIIAGIQNGFSYDNSVISKINNSSPDILIIGLGSCKQEEWIISNRELLDCPVVIAVGDGIKVFAGNKVRGPKFLQLIGLEWFIRLVNNPSRYWQRYIIGIPLFLFNLAKYRRKLIQIIHYDDN